jgi:hypothetical protein
VDARDIGIRALKTFVQVFLVAVPATIITTSEPLPVLYAGALSAGAAALSVIWNALLQWSRTE